MTQVETYVGVNGAIQSTPDGLVLTKSGLGVDKARREIPLATISGVRITPPTRMGTRGFLTLGLDGAPAAVLSAMRAVNDLNSVLFKKSQQEAFQRLHDWLVQVLAQNRANGSDVPNGAADRRAQRAVDKEAKSVAKAEQAAADLESYGAEIKRVTFGEKSIALYQLGYVRIGTFKLGNYEKLRSINYSRTVRDKSLGGRAGAAMLTGGLSLLTSKEKMNCYLTIVTEAGVHSLHVEGTLRAEKAGLAIEGAGNALVEALRDTMSAPALAPTASAGPDVADQIKKLAELHAAGILTDDEFSSKKAGLLDRM